MLVTSFHEFRGLVKNVYFLIILCLGTGFIFLLGFRNVGLIRGTLTYPVTFQVLDMTKNSLYLFSLVIILFCSGELVWRERKKRVQEIYDVLPIPEWVPFMGKLGAIFLVQILLVTVVFISRLNRKGHLAAQEGTAHIFQDLHAVLALDPFKIETAAVDLNVKGTVAETHHPGIGKIGGKGWMFLADDVQQSLPGLLPVCCSVCGHLRGRLKISILNGLFNRLVHGMV